MLLIRKRCVVIPDKLDSIRKNILSDVISPDQMQTGNSFVNEMAADTANAVFPIAGRAATT